MSNMYIYIVKYSTVRLYPISDPPLPKSNVPPLGLTGRSNIEHPDAWSSTWLGRCPRWGKAPRHSRHRNMAGVGIWKTYKSHYKNLIIKLYKTI